MKDTNKVLIGVGVLGALGVGIYLLTRRTSTTTKDPTKDSTNCSDKYEHALHALHA